MLQQKILQSLTQILQLTIVKKRWILLKHAILGYLPAEQQQWMIMLGHSQ